MAIVSGIIILDGPDVAGKSTLAKHLCSKFLNSEYVHLGKPNPGQAWSDHKDALLTAIKSVRSNKLVVIDRHFMSEAIYGGVYRKGSEYPFAARHIDRLLYRFGAVRVVCAPPVNHIVTAHRRMCLEREEMYHDGMDKIAELYLSLWYGIDDLAQTFVQPLTGYVENLTAHGGVADKLGWLKYDVSTDGLNMDQYADKLISHLNDLRRLLPNFAEHTDNWTGWARRQSVLLVGDQSSKPDSHWPFLSNSGSSVYLAQVLNQLGVDESRICMTNAMGPNGAEMLAKGRVYCGRVVAMGRLAEAALERERVTYDARVRHPQHARRFSAKDSSWADELQAAFNGFAGVNK